MTDRPINQWDLACWILVVALLASGRNKTTGHSL